MNKLFNFSSDNTEITKKALPVKSLEQLQKELIENESDHG